MTDKDKASYDSTPPCTMIRCILHRPTFVLWVALFYWPEGGGGGWVTVPCSNVSCCCGMPCSNMCWCLGVEVCSMYAYLYVYTCLYTDMFIRTNYTATRCRCLSVLQYMYICINVYVYMYIYNTLNHRRLRVCIATHMHMYCNTHAYFLQHTCSVKIFFVAYV